MLFFIHRQQKALEIGRAHEYNHASIRVVWGHAPLPPPRKLDKIASETIATTLMGTSIIHTAFDSLGHRLGQGINLVPGVSVSFVLAYSPILSQFESRLKMQTLTHLAGWCGLREAD